MGSTDVEAALIDMLTEHIRDIKQKYTDCKHSKSGEELECAKTSWIDKDLPPWMMKLEQCVGKSGFSVGSKISLADVSIYIFVNEFFDYIEGAKASISSCPGLKAISDNVSLAAQSCLNSRPVTQL